MARAYERVEGEAGRICGRVKDTVLFEGRAVERRCDGNLRRLYVREVREGAAKGWRVVGTVCLLCHEVRLDPERLPPPQPTEEERHEMWRKRQGLQRERGAGGQGAETGGA